MTSMAAARDRDARDMAGSRRATFRMGSDAPLRRGGAGRTASTVDGFWIDRYAVTNRRVRGVRRARPATSRSPSARSTRPPSRARRPRTSSPGSLVFTRTRGPGRPAPPRPVVDVDAGRVAGGTRRARARRSPAAWIIRSSTSPTRTPRPTRPGRARRCRPRPSGSSPRAAASTAPPTRGATSPSPPASGSPTTGTATSRGAPSPATARPRRSARSRPTATACTTWPATSGSGRRDWYAATRATSRRPASPCCLPHNPRGADASAQPRPRPAAVPRPRKVVKGGSFLCADSYCLRYRPAARRPQMVDTGMSHVGFRCVRRAPALTRTSPVAGESAHPRARDGQSFHPSNRSNGVILAADYPFMDILWSMIIFFSWVIWIWIMIVILTDVFRRQTSPDGSRRRGSCS